MSITRKSGPVGAITIVLALVLAVSVVALTGCYSTSPGGPTGTGVSEEEKALEVPAGEKAAISDALTAAGISGDPMYTYMTYASQAKDTVIVRGQLKNKDGGAVSKATLKKSGDTWTVESTQ